MTAVVRDLLSKVPAAYGLTRPLGATLGDTLTKPTDDGGLNFSRIASSLVIARLMIVIVALTHRVKRDPLAAWRYLSAIVRLAEPPSVLRTF